MKLLNGRPFLFLSLLATLLLIIFGGCTQLNSLNLKRHQFNQVPLRIVWLQVAGLNEEHLAMLKFEFPSESLKTSFEEVTCFGKAWDYNLFKIRPSAQESFLAQLSGKSNIRGKCSDYNETPIWKLLQLKGFDIGIFESETVGNSSLLHSKSCSEGQAYLNDTYFWKMGKANNNKSEFFHVGEVSKFSPNTVYYDRSCSKGACFSTLEQNIKKVFSDFSRNSRSYLYLIRDFEFQNLLVKRKINAAQSKLIQLNNVIKYFHELSQKSENFMLLVSSAAAHTVIFPKKGKEWREFEKKGKYFISKNAELLSSVYAYGARAENFCGIYSQSEIFRRILSGVKIKEGQFNIFNSFGN